MNVVFAPRAARRLLGLAAALALAGAADAASPLYTQVQPGAQVSFQAKQMGVAMKGHFATVQAQVRFAPADLQASRVSVAVACASVHAGGSQADSLLRGPDWLDAKAHPQARFVSTAFTADGPGRYWVDGRFTVRGTTHPMRVLLLTHAAGADLAMDVDFRLDRGSYGVGGGSWADTSVVSGEIPVHVHLLVAR
jgi:polyisoprenoid-binding protein YceI